MVLLLWVPNRILIWFPGGHLLWCRCFWSQVGSCCGILASGPMCALDMVLLLLVPSGLLRPLRLVPSELPIWCRCFWPRVRSWIWCRCICSQVGSRYGVVPSGPEWAPVTVLLSLVSSELLIGCRPSGLLIWCRCSCSQVSSCYGVVACS